MKINRNFFKLSKRELLNGLKEGFKGGWKIGFTIGLVAGAFYAIMH